jgi:hypothetical protein
VSRIAVVGSGISGLATAWLLSRQHDVELFEKDARLGGHTHTHQIDTPRGPLGLDTGFLVHNTRTYPRLIRLFAELGVECLDSDMSFGVRDRRDGFEYGTHSPASLFADPRAFVRPSHYVMLAEIVRFGRAARRFIAASRGTAGSAGVTLGEFLDRHRFRGAFVERYLWPLAASIWSASLDTLAGFPALTLVTFFDNHGMLNVLDHPTWRVVRGGSATYIPKLLDSPRIVVHRSTPPVRITRGAGGVTLEFAARPALTTDAVVLACRGGDAVALLADPTPVEREVLGAFRTSTNDAWLHTDASWLPRRHTARAAWNYVIGGPSSEGATVTYWLNRLQRLSGPVEYCVTLNPPEPINPAAVLFRMTYQHPLYTRAAVDAQARWAEVSTGRTSYAGAYWFYGFHEDGLRSAVRVAEAFGVTW